VSHGQRVAALNENTLPQQAAWRKCPAADRQVSPNHPTAARRDRHIIAGGVDGSRKIAAAAGEVRFRRTAQPGEHAPAARISLAPPPTVGTFLGTARSAGPGCVEAMMGQTSHVNATCEHALFLRLFVSNGGGW
jgi:hypothetical protein